MFQSWLMMPVLPSFFILKVLNIHIYWSKHFLCKISKIMWHLHHLGFGHLDSFIPLCFLLSVCFLVRNGNCRVLGATLLGILPDGYSVWIRSKFQPRPECVCWTAHCISGDHTGSISTSKSLCCPLSLSEHLPLGPRSEVQHQRGTCAKMNTCCWAANYPSASLHLPLVHFN